MRIISKVLLELDTEIGHYKANLNEGFQLLDISYNEIENQFSIIAINDDKRAREIVRFALLVEKADFNLEQYNYLGKTLFSSWNVPVYAFHIKKNEPKPI